MRRRLVFAVIFLGLTIGTLSGGSAFAQGSNPEHTDHSSPNDGG